MELKEKIAVKSDKVASRIIDKEAVIVILDKQQTIVLNEVGSRIWEIIDEKKSVDDFARTVASEFDITYDEATKDIVEFIEDLAQRGAILIK
jgi:hypothetical protein